VWCEHRGFGAVVVRVKEKGNPLATVLYASESKPHVRILIDDHT